MESCHSLSPARDHHIERTHRGDKEGLRERNPDHYWVYRSARQRKAEAREAKEKD